MADSFVALTVNAAGSVAETARGADGIDALITAIGTDVDTTCDTALAVPAIDADVDSENAVEAIRTAVDAAIATAAAARTAENSGTVMLRYDTSLTRNQLITAVEFLLNRARNGGIIA